MKKVNFIFLIVMCCKILFAGEYNLSEIKINLKNKAIVNKSLTSVVSDILRNKHFSFSVEDFSEYESDTITFTENEMPLDMVLDKICKSYKNQYIWGYYSDITHIYFVRKELEKNKKKSDKILSRLFLKNEKRHNVFENIFQQIGCNIVLYPEISTSWQRDFTEQELEDKISIDVENKNVRYIFAKLINEIKNSNNHIKYPFWTLTYKKNEKIHINLVIKNIE